MYFDTLTPYCRGITDYDQPRSSSSVSGARFLSCDTALKCTGGIHLRPGRSRGQRLLGVHPHRGVFPRIEGEKVVLGDGVL